MRDPSLDHVSSEDTTTDRFNSFECRQGRVSKIMTGEPNPRVPGTVIKSFYVQVDYLEGGGADVCYFGHGIDPVTKKLHGSLIPPVEGQQVLVLFPYGNYLQPVGAIPLPYPFYTKELQREDYHLLNRLDTIQDIEHGHRTGSVLRFRQDGAVEVENWKADASEVQSSVKMNADGTIVVSHNKGASINIDADGNVQVVPASGKKVNVGAAAPTYGAARLEDEVKSTAAEDATFWTTWQTWWTTWQVGWLAALVPLAASAIDPLVKTYAAALTTLLGGMPTPPTSMTGKITVASTVVKVE
jgi:hypothetical protein